MGCRSHLARCGAWCWLALLPVGRVHAQDLSTTNQNQINRFFNTVNQASRPVTVVAFGDSMADSYRSIPWALANQMTLRLGVSGYSFDGGGKMNLWLTNGATEVGPTSYWFAEQDNLPPGGGVAWQWGASIIGVGLRCDHVGIYWVAQPAGGNFTLNISTNGGPWSPLLVLNGYAPTATGQFTNVAVPLNNYRIGATSQTGNNVILGPSMLNQSQTNGLHLAYVSYGGIALSDMTNVARAIREPVFKALAPDLLVWHMKEDGTDATLQGLLECEDWWATAIPGCDVIYIGTYYVAPENGGTNITIGQNQLVRSVAVAKQRAYMDCMNPSISYDWLVTNGFMADTVHLNSSGGLYFGNLMWNDLNFFAMRLNRRLSVQSTSTNLLLEWLGNSGAYYDLETSPDQSNWSVVQTMPGGNNMVTNIVAPAPGNQFYRLQLRAN